MLRPGGKMELKVSEVEFLRTPKGRQLMARVYQPQGTGPFPTVLDLHGGAWRRKDRLAEEPMDRAIASSGVLVVAIDLRLSDEAPYPASVQDANYGVRWLKSRAAEWNGDASRIGVYGSSSGGHVAQLLALRPRDARYTAIPLASAPGLDATLAYVATRSPISDTVARFQQAEKMKREAMIENNRIYFTPWETIHAATADDPCPGDGQGLHRAPAEGVRPFRLEEATIDELQAAIRSGEITCVQIVQRYLDRARAYNGVASRLVTGDGRPVAPATGAVRAGAALAFPAATVRASTLFVDLDRYKGPPLEFGRMEATASDPAVLQQYGMIAGVPNGGQLNALATLNIRGERSV